MEPLQIRESEIFKMLKSLKKLDFVVIGGYAVNAYTLPRFSVDCDMVIRSRSELMDIGPMLLEYGYKKKGYEGENAKADFIRYEKAIEDPFSVSLDILIGEVLDRQTGVSIQSEWIFKNSEIRVLKGKTIKERLDIRIINSDALFVMKMISCRQTDIRDIFMLSSILKDKGWIRKEIADRYDFNNRLRRVKSVVNSKDFRNGLQGIYGYVDEKTFERNITAISSLGDY